MTTKMIIISAVVLLLAGCPSHQIDKMPMAAIASGESINRAEIRGETAKEQAEAAKPHADETGKTHLDVATTELTKQSDDLKEAKTQLGKAVDERNSVVTALVTETGKYDTLEGKWYVRIGKWIERMLWILATTLALGVVLRIVSLLVTGPVGALCSLVSTGIFGVMTGGISLIQATADNLHLRGISPSGKPNAPTA